MKTKTRTGKATVLLTLICYSLIAASACEQPPGRYAPPSSGIGGAEDLAKIGVDPDWPMDGAYTLGADITLTDWEPLGAYTNKFSGTFDGGNHTITIENGRGGLFAYASGAMIKNLKVAGTITVTEEGALQIGGVAGNIEGTIIENCASSIVIDAVGHGHNSAAAGIVGFMRDNSTVRSCSATGSVSLKTGPGEGLMIYAGGVAGYSGTGTAGEGSSGCLIVRSSWTGGAVYAEAGYPYAGGVVGYNYTGAKTVECFSAGSVTAKGENLPYAGGITGYNSGYVQDAIPPTPPVTVAVIENCYSTVRVSAESPGRAALAGGISGSNAKGALIAQCYATGLVTARVAGSGSDYIGGTLGVPLAANAGGIAGAQYYTEYEVNPRIEYCAALNAGISGEDPGGGGAVWNVYRIAGAGSAGNDTGELLNNIANPLMTLTTGTQPRTLTDADKGGHTKDGADAAAPETAFTALGWDFVAVWKMDDGGYPALRWEP